MAQLKFTAVGREAARRLWSATVTYSVIVAPGASEFECHQTPLAQS